MSRPHLAGTPTIARAGLLLVLLAFAGLLLGVPATPALAIPGPSTPPVPVGERGALVRVGDDATLEVGQTTDAVVVIGGDADVAGTVRTSVVVIGGDAVIRSTAQIGLELTNADAAIVVVGGEVKQDPGAAVTGTTQVVSLTAPRLNVAGAAWHALSHPHISVAGWLGNTIFYSVVALVVVALFQRQLRAIRDRALAEPLASLGWGALTAFLTLVVALILAATIIGLIVVIPGLLFSPFVMLFIAGAAAFSLGELLLGRIWAQPPNVFLAALTGVFVLQLLGLIPIVGGIVNFAAWLIALGAAAWALLQWRRDRQARMRGGMTGAPAPTPTAD